MARTKKKTVPVIGEFLQIFVLVLVLATVGVIGIGFLLSMYG